jgi:nucleoside-diphosphate-sugar epimerase
VGAPRRNEISRGHRVLSCTLVTGAAGFIGSHLINEMHRRGLQARGVTRGVADGLITIPTYAADFDWSQLLVGVDSIVHLAARVHVMQETADDPIAVFRSANVDATLNLARQAANSGIRRFIFISSIKVNGEQTPLGTPFSADDPMNPQDPYGVSKAEAEIALRKLGSETGMEITIIRPPLVYGRGVGGNFKSLTKWASSGVPSVLSRIKNKRSFIYVENLCDLIIETINNKNAANKTFLASDGQDLSTHELLTLLMHALGRRPRSVPVPLSALTFIGRVTGKQQTISRLSESLQVNFRSTTYAIRWTPPYSVEDALKATVSANSRSS